MIVKVEIVFATMLEARDFFDAAISVSSPNVPQQAPQQGPAATVANYQQMENMKVQNVTAATAAVPPEDPIKALREAAASLIARMPAGEGPKKVRELLTAQGITKFADANPQQATALAAQMNAA